MTVMGRKTQVSFASQTLVTTAPVRESKEKAAGRMQHQGTETTAARALLLVGDLRTRAPKHS